MILKSCKEQLLTLKILGGNSQHLTDLFLKIDETLAHFQSFGRIPSLIDLLYSIASGISRILAISCKTLGCIPSGPGDLSNFKLASFFVYLSWLYLSVFNRFSVNISIHIEFGYWF